MGGRQERDFEEAPLERPPSLEEARHRQRTQRVAVIGALAGDEALLRRQPTRVPVLQRHLHRRLDRLRAAARVHDVSELVCAEPERSEEYTSELQSPCNLVCRLLLEKKNT